MDYQEAWRIAVTRLHKKFNRIDPEVPVRALNDLEALGVSIDPWTPKRPTTPRRTNRTLTRPEPPTTPTPGEDARPAVPGPSVPFELELVVSPAQAHPAQPLETFKQHPHRNNTSDDWTLIPLKPILIIGDSNLSRLPPIKDPNIQLDCFPGCNMSSATLLLKNRTPTSISTDTVILSFGLEDRSHSDKTQLERILRGLLEAAGATFPYAKIWTPLINIHPTFKHREKANLEYLNILIQKTPNPIPVLDDNWLIKPSEGYLWTPETGKLIWSHWCSFLKVTHLTTAPISTLHNSVINLSTSFHLNPMQQKLLEKGLSFVPTASHNPKQEQELLAQLKSYHRRLKIHTFFSGEQKRETPPPIPTTVSLDTGFSNTPSGPPSPN